MNPLDLHGPEFLLFYLFLIAVTVIALIILRRASEGGDAPKMNLADPYLIAYLRGGKNEALRVAVVSLVDRGLLVAQGHTLTRAEHATTEAVRHPIEKCLLENFATSGEASTIFDDVRLEATCAPYREKLEKQGLLPDTSVVKARYVRLIWALLLLEGLGTAKILVALSRGRYNIGFLVVLMIAAIIVAALVSFPRLTARGAAMLEDLESLYAGLKDRAYTIRSGGATADAVMLAGVFGISALDNPEFAFTQTLFPRAMRSPATSSWGSSWGSSCSSSCGSSCGSSSDSSGGSSCGSGGSSCGSSCGGGGCGGGCGGCGS